MTLLVLLYITNFLRTILIIVLVYYGIRFVTRHILPFFVSKGVKNIQQKMYEQQMQSQRNSRKEGEVTIESKNKNGAYSQKNQGEYVDFEEVE